MERYGFGGGQHRRLVKFDLFQRAEHVSFHREPLFHANQIGVLFYDSRIE
jgi:hypothetical protein